MEGKKVQSIEKKSSPKRTRALSTIKFPYGDLNEAIKIATVIHSKAGQSCTRDQLAGFMNQSVDSGAFRSRLSTAITFGVIEAERGGRVNLTNMGEQLVDSNTASQAKVTAFFTVPLYKEIYNKYKGKVLPPRAGLEREIQNLGVSPKQKDKARQVFERSAEQAGFFEYGKERLIEPVLGMTPPKPDETPPPDSGNNGGGSGGDGGNGFHPFIQGLLAELPQPHSQWAVNEQVQWLQTAANIFGLLYKRDNNIVVTSENKNPETASD